jgi:hypothetical protein
MAHRHGLAGQYGKTEATQLHWRGLGLLVGSITLFFVAYGFIWGYFWSKYGATLALVPVLAFIGLSFYG